MTLPETTTPAALARHLGWSERRVRREARRLCACCVLGNRMVLLPEHVEAIKNNTPLPGGTPTFKPSYVYFVGVRGFIKIGWTHNWKSRLINLQSSNPERISVLLILRESEAAEKRLHSFFAKHRKSGEWFRDHPDIRDFIATRERQCAYREEREQ